MVALEFKHFYIAMSRTKAIDGWATKANQGVGPSASHRRSSYVYARQFTWRKQFMPSPAFLAIILLLTSAKTLAESNLMNINNSHSSPVLNIAKDKPPMGDGLMSYRMPEGSTWIEEGDASNLADLLGRLQQTEDRIWNNVNSDADLLQQLLELPQHSFISGTKQANAIERVLNGLRRTIGMLRWQYRELLELFGSTLVQSAGASRERLGTLRLLVSNALRSVSIYALDEYEDFAGRLKTKPKESMLLAREFGAEMALVAHRVEKMSKKHRQLCDANGKLEERVRLWDQDLTTQLLRMSERTMEELRIQIESYVVAAASAMSLKEAEFTRFLKTSRMQELHFQSIMDSCIHQLTTKGVAVIDISKAWGSANPGVRSADEWISKILNALTTMNLPWAIYPVFVHVDEQDVRYPGGAGRLQLQPSVRTIQAALEPLFDEPGLSQYSMVSISQLLTRTFVASANVTGMAVSPTSVVVCTEPAVVSSAKHFGFHFTRRISSLKTSDFSINNDKQKVVVAYLGQIALGEYKGNEMSLDWISQLSRAIVSFLSFEAAGPFELHELRSRVKNELAYVAAIERNCKMRLLSSALVGYEALMENMPEDLGYFKLFRRHNTGVFIAITPLPALQLPLSSFFRASVCVMRIEVARSRYGRKEYVVPSRDTVLMALTHLYLYPMEGNAQALVRTELKKDTRFSFLRVKAGVSTGYVVTSQRRFILGRDHLTDLRGQHVHRDSMVATLMSYISSDFMPQNVDSLKSKLEGRLLYVQVCFIGENCK